VKTVPLNFKDDSKMDMNNVYDAKGSFGNMLFHKKKIWEDQSKYGMPVPEELQELFDFDPAIEKAFENLLPGKRRNYLHQIASAKTEPTRTKRVLKLLKDLGIQNVG